MKAVPQTPQPAKFSVIDRLKNFFKEESNDANYETVNVMNDASFHVPMSQRAVRHIQYDASRPNLDRLSMTLPNTVQKRQQQFSIEDDDDETPEPVLPEKELSAPVSARAPPQLPTSFAKLQEQGFEEIDIKPVGSSKLVEPTKEPYQKGTIICFPPTSTIKITKEPKIFDSIFEYLVGSVSREVVMDGGWIYFLKKQGKDKFRVCSATQLDRLFKIIVKKTEKKAPIKLAFINRQSNYYQMPEVKEFTLINKEQQELFFIKLRSEVQKHGLDLMFRK